jgi:16S rRNA (cytosine967-C5)-methyltransferase
LPFASHTFDAVLVDAPCSGTGTLRRNPEIRWRITPADLVDLPARQAKLLENAVEVLAAKGRLIYSTCSIEREENEEVVEQFLSAHKEFERVRIESKSAAITESGDIRTWPNTNGTDGFFIAVLRRKSD